VLKKFTFVTVFFLATLSSAYAQLPNFTDLVEAASPAVVKINTLSRGQKQRSPPMSQNQIPESLRELFEQRQRPQARRSLRSMGSGFVISDDGYILTNHHVVDEADEIQVLFSDRREYTATVVGSDRRSDLALLKIDAKNLSALEFADSDTLKAGAWVVAIGSPFGLDYSVTAGIVSAIGRSIPTEKGENYVPFIQTDVAINPGNSGGPLFNLEGQVVGINSQIYSRSGGSIGLSFAIPSRVAMGVIEQLKDNGTVQRGWFGVGIQEVTKSLAESLQLGTPKGALITSVETDSPAAKGGVQPGDVVVRVNDQSITESGDLPHVVGMIMPGDKAQVDIYRKGRRKTLTVVVGSLANGDQESLAKSTDGADSLGIIAEDLQEEERLRLRLRGGVLVTQVTPASPASEARLQVDDIIVQLGYSRIDDIAEYREVIKQLPKNMPVAIRFYRQGRAIFRTIQIAE
jgi:serine protease Do